MKNKLKIFCLFAITILLSSCIDVIRGNKNITYINKTFDSGINLDAKTGAIVQADKEYKDVGKVNSEKNPTK